MSDVDTESSATIYESTCVTCGLIGDCPTCESDQLCVLSSQTCDACPNYYCMWIPESGHQNSYPGSNNMIVNPSDQNNTLDGTSNSTNDTTTLSDQHANTSPRILIAGIVGGITGGVTLLGITVLAILFWRYRSKIKLRDDNYSNNSDNSDHFGKISSFSCDDNYNGNNSLNEHQWHGFETNQLQIDENNSTKSEDENGKLFNENHPMISSIKPKITTWSSIIEDNKFLGRFVPGTTGEDNNSIPLQRLLDEIRNDAARDINTTNLSLSAPNSNQSDTIPITYHPELTNKYLALVPQPCPHPELRFEDQRRLQNWQTLLGLEGSTCASHMLSQNTTSNLHNNQYNYDNINNSNIQDLEISGPMNNEDNQSKTISKFIINDVDNQALLRGVGSDYYYDEVSDEIEEEEEEEEEEVYFDEMDNDGGDYKGAYTAPDFKSNNPNRKRSSLLNFDIEEMAKKGTQVNFLIENMKNQGFI